MDKYKKIKEIGKGNYGKALLVQSLKDNNLYVIKIIDISNFNSEQYENATYEVNVLKSLNHPYIIKHIESFCEKNQLCIVMEYADSGDLGKLIKSQQQIGIYLKEDIILNWFVQLCFALKYLHEKKIIHRDLKLSNVFLCSSGDVKLGDFGIAKILNSREEFAKTLVGTPYYLSPEICMKKKYNSKSDIWSLGCVLFECMFLKHAFEGNNIGELIKNILSGNINKMDKKFFSEESRNLIKEILTTKANKRPDVNQILSRNVLQKYIKMNLIKQISINENKNSYNNKNIILHCDDNNNENNDDNKNNVISKNVNIKNNKENYSHKLKMKLLNYNKNKNENKDLQNIINTLKEENDSLKSKIQKTNKNNNSYSNSIVVETRDYFIPDFSWERTDKEFIVIIEVCDIVKELKCSVAVIEGNYLFRFTGIKILLKSIQIQNKNCYYSSNRKEGKFQLEFTIPLKDIQLKEKNCKKLEHNNGVYIFHFDLITEYMEQSFNI